MIIKAKHNFIVYPFFKWYAQFIIKRHFAFVKIIGELPPITKPVLVISNHVSWWDGFWVMYVNLKMLRLKFHFMMLEEQLRKYWLFKYAGAFSVNKNSKSLVETLNYTSELLNDNRNMVLIFPQGKITSMHQQTIEFEKGLERILKNKENAIQIIFLANMVDYFSHRKPSAFLYIQSNPGNAVDLKTIQDKYNLFYAQSLLKQNDFNSL